MRSNEIYAGDCVELLKNVEKESVDLVFADPPFNIGYEYDVYDDRRETEDYVSWCTQWMQDVHNCLKPNGTFWLAIGDEYAAELKVAAQNEVGFHCRSWVIWYYTFGVNCVRGFSRSHTHLFHFVKDPNNFTFNANNPTVRVASARQLVYADARANPKGRLPDNTWILRPQDAPDDSFLPKHDTWYFSRVAGTFKERQGFHGCQMPEQLLGRIIRISSHPTDTVLDPFSGSGTTLAVAKKLGRHWMGFELSKKYAKEIQSRLKEIKVGDDLVGPADPAASAPSTSNGKKKVGVQNGRTIPKSDNETDKEIIAAFNATHAGYSADYLLCEPELNEAFAKECKRRGVPGVPFVWNRLLLRLRKAGKLPKNTKSQKRLTFAEMDPYSFASEIALRHLELDYDLTLDDVLCSPDAVKEFDQIAAEFAPGFSSFEYRWAAMAIRKRAMKAKLEAAEIMTNLDFDALPSVVRLDDFQSATTGLSSDDDPDCNAFGTKNQSGVYILSNDAQVLYVGESCEIATRLKAMSCNGAWQQLEAHFVQILEAGDMDTAGLQSALIGHLQPMLNTALLEPAEHASPATVS